MKFYRVLCYDCESDVWLSSWFTTKREAEKHARELQRDDQTFKDDSGEKTVKFDSVQVQQITVPTTKPDLCEFLNRYAEH